MMGLFEPCVNNECSQIALGNPANVCLSAGDKGSGGPPGLPGDKDSCKGAIRGPAGPPGPDGHSGPPGQSFNYISAH